MSANRMSVIPVPRLIRYLGKVPVAPEDTAQLSGRTTVLFLSSFFFKGQWHCCHCWPPLLPFLSSEFVRRALGNTMIHVPDPRRNHGILPFSFIWMKAFYHMRLSVALMPTTCSISKIKNQFRVKDTRCVAAEAGPHLHRQPGSFPSWCRSRRATLFPPFFAGERQSLLEVPELDLSNTSRNWSLDLAQSSCFSINPELEEFRAQGKLGDWLLATTGQLATS